MEPYMTTSTGYMNEIPGEPEIRKTFCECLSEARAMFGTLSPGWQYKIQLRYSPPYPETVTIGTDMVCVWLTKERSRVGYLFEAGHEAVHCLNPGPLPSTYLEEAVATAFSQWLVSDRFGPPGLERVTLTSDYKFALEMAATIDRDIVRLGKRLRGHVGSLRTVSPKAVMDLYPQAQESTVWRILEMFPRQSESESSSEL